MNSSDAASFLLFSGIGLIIMILLIIWSMVWKGLALWRAARNGHTGWYIVLLIVNTVGLLDIIYYFAVGDQTKK
jgi:hypothetical protein